MSLLKKVKQNVIFYNSLDKIVLTKEEIFAFDKYINEILIPRIIKNSEIGINITQINMNNFTNTICDYLELPNINLTTYDVKSYLIDNPTFDGFNIDIIDNEFIIISFAV